MGFVPAHEPQTSTTGTVRASINYLLSMLYKPDYDPKMYSEHPLLKANVDNLKSKVVSERTP